MADIGSDLSYLITVPIYDTGLFGSIVTSMVLPIIPQLYFAVQYANRKEYDEEKRDWVTRKDPIGGIKFFFLGYIGLFDLSQSNLQIDKANDQMSDLERSI